jgi:hypothetical protein
MVVVEKSDRIRIGGAGVPVQWRRSPCTSGQEGARTLPQTAYGASPYVDSAPLGTPATQWQIFELAGDGPDVLRLRPHRKGRMVPLIGAGVALYVGGLITWLSYGLRDLGTKDDRWFFVVAGGATLLVVGLAAYLAWGSVVSGDVVFDRRAGTASGRAWTGRGLRDIRVRLADVNCVQFCSRDVVFQDEPGYHTYELNLVVFNPQHPPARRLGLGSHAERTVVAADAARVAGFLGVGVLDDCARSGRYRHDEYDPRQVSPFNVADR